MQIATENDSKEASVNGQKEETDDAVQIAIEKKTVVVDTNIKPNTCDETKGIETKEHQNKQNITQNM